MKVRVLTISAVVAAAGAGAVLAGAGSPAEAPRAAAPAMADTYKIDAVHSSVVFRIKHNGVANFYGRFNKFGGDFAWDSSKPEATTLTATIDASSIDSNNAKRDDHLRSPDFFNTKEFPEIKFTAKSLKKEGSLWKLQGDLTLLGKTREVVGDFTPTGEKTTDKGSLAGFEAVFTFKRADFGMNYGVANGALSDEVTVIVAIEGAKK